MIIEAISNVCCPFTQLLESINDVQESIKTNCSSMIILAFENIFKICFITEENQKFKGKEFKTLDIFKDNLKIIFSKLLLNIYIISCSRYIFINFFMFTDEFKSSNTNLNHTFIALETIKKQLDTHKNKYYSRKLSTNLVDYSPWLAQFSDHNIDTIEVPGQYSGIKKPNVDNHITITSFKPKVKFLNQFYNNNDLNIVFVTQGTNNFFNEKSN